MKKIISFIALSFLCIPLYAADTLNDQIFTIDDFSKSLNTKVSTYSLKPGEPDICENIRFNTSLKALTKRQNLYLYGTADTTEAITGMQRFYKKDGTKCLIVTHGDEIEKGSDSAGTFSNILNLSSSGHKWQFVVWNDVLVGTDGYNHPIKYDGTSVSATYLGSCLGTDAGSGAGPNGTYTYKVSFYTTTPAYEVIFNVASNPVTVVDNDITLTMIPIAPTNYNGAVVTGRKVYRSEVGGAGTYKLLSNGTIANNTAVTLTDSDADGALGASYPSGDSTWTPPLARFLIVHSDRLWLGNTPSTNPSRLHYGESGSVDLFDVDTYYDIRNNDGDQITFLKQVLGLLTIGKNNSIQKLYTDGDPDTDWKLSDPLSFSGCSAPYSAVNSPIGIIYLNNTGLYKFNGQYSSLISEVVTPEIKDISPSNLENCWGFFHENQYYLAYQSERSGEIINNRILLYDVLANAYEIDTMYTNSFCAFNSGTDWDTLYMGASNSGKVFSYTTESVEVVHKTHGDFLGLWDDMRYIPTSVGGDSEDPVLEISRTETIDEMTGTIDGATGIIDRNDYMGNYTSQPLSINSAVLDKFYWNVSMPSGGGQSSVQFRTSPTGEANLLHNDDFDQWDNYKYDTDTTIRPNDWLFSQGGTGGAATASTTAYRGTSSAQLTKPNTGATVISQRISATPYLGKVMVFNGWIKSANSATGSVLAVIDDLDGTPTRWPYTTTGAWQNFATTKTISATATSVTVKFSVDSTATAIALIDQVMFKEGTTCLNDWTGWSTEYTNGTGADISGETTDAYIEYRVNATTTTLTQTPIFTKENGYNFRMTFNRENALQTDSIPLSWRSGWLDFSQPTRIKSLKYLYVYHEGTEGTLTIKFENHEGDTDTFNIDLTTNPIYYREAFTSGKFVGQLFRITITNNDNKPLKIKKLVAIYDIEGQAYA